MVRITPVASFAEAWIEISTPDTSKRTGAVASFAEAWIEIMVAAQRKRWKAVASFAEAWIEIHQLHNATKYKQSPPSRRRGLKSCVASLISLINRRLLRGGVD